MKAKYFLAVFSFFLVAIFLMGCQQVDQVITPDDSLQKVYLTPADSAGVIYMILAEKLALDVYSTLYTSSGIVEFSNIAASEQHHIDRLLNMIYNHTDIISDPTVGLEYPDKYKILFDGLNIITEEDALNAGIDIETFIIADYTAYRDLVNPDNVFLYNLYTNLLASSQDHLTVFTRLLSEL